MLGVLTERGYEMESGNRFVRTVGQPNLSAPADHPHDLPADGGSNEDPLVLTIDVLVPSYSARHEPNQPVGELTVDAIPGLSLALARPTIAITVTAQLREPTLADTVNLPTTFRVLVPGPLSALAVKALAWASRHSPAATSLAMPHHATDLHGHSSRHPQGQ